MASNSTSFCDEDRFNNAFYLLKKTVDFLTSEFDMHFVILSAYQSNKSQSVTAALTSPGPAAKFFDEGYSSKTTSKDSPTGLIDKWDSFSKNYCFHGNAQMFSNVPPYTEFIKSDLSNERQTTNGATASSLFPPEMPEPPSNILSETLYYCNGEFRSEDSENEVSSSSDGCGSGDENAKKKSGHHQQQGLKRKSLQDVSDQLAKKAVAVNYYRPIYPAAPKVVTPAPSDTDAVLNLSKKLLRPANGSIVQPDLTSSMFLNTVQSLLSQSQLAAALTQPKYNSCNTSSNHLLSSASPPPSKTTLNNNSISFKANEHKNGLSSASSLVINVDPKPAKSNGKSESRKSNNRAPVSPMKSSPFNANGTPKQMWPCTYCSKEFASQSTMKRHLNHFHLKVHSYTCSHCQEVFYRKDKLVAHSKIKHGVDISRSARMLTQTTTSPNGSTTTNSTLSPVSPSNSSNSPNSTPNGGNSNYAATPSPVPSPSPNTCVVQPMTPPSVSASEESLSPLPPLSIATIAV